MIHLYRGELACLAACAAILSTPLGAAAVDLKIERATLANGVRLVMSRQPAVPIVAITCLVDGGVRVDPPEHPGLAGMTAALLEEGTKKRTSKEIARLVDSLGGSFGAQASGDWTTVASFVLARDFDTGVDLVAQSLREPTFPPEEVDRIRAEILGGIEASEEEPGYVAARSFAKALFGDVPYGHPSEGTADSVRAISRDDIVAFHRREMRPEGTICGVVGDVAPERMRTAMAGALEGWQAELTPYVAPTATVRAAEKINVDRPTAQANIILGHLGVARTNPDYFAVLLMNHILGGGGFTSRLMQKVRTESGLAYSISSYFAASRYPGPFEVTLQTKVESAADAIAQVRAEIERLHRDGATQEELAAAQDYLTGSFPLRLDTTSKLADLLSQVEYFGLGDDYIETYADKVRAVTLDDVKRAARTYLHPDELVQVVVGPASVPAPIGPTATPSSRSSS